MSRANTRMTILRTTALAVLSGIFLYAGATKAINPAALADAIDGYRLPIRPVTGTLATTLPAIEIAAALALWHPRWRGAALLTLVGMCVVFLTALIQAAARGFTVDCGCFGTAAPSVAGMVKAILRDCALVAGAVWCYARHTETRPVATPAVEDDADGGELSPEG